MGFVQGNKAWLDDHVNEEHNTVYVGAAIVIIRTIVGSVIQNLYKSGITDDWL